MDALNEDCLREIFSYFPMKQRFKLERVCRRWRHVMPYHKVECEGGNLNILNVIEWQPEHLVPVKHGPCLHCENDTTSFIRQSSLLEAMLFFLKRLGKWLKGISFNSSCNLACLITPDIFQTIHTYCKNLIDLRLDRCLIMNTALKYLKENFLLQSITIDYCTIIDSDHFAVIDGCSHIQDLISKWAQSLNFLDLRGIKKARLQLSQCCQGYGNLTKVVLSDCYTMATDLKSLIVQNQSTIRHLEISACGSISRFDSIRLLTKLIDFTLRQSMINVSDFVSICENCKNIRHLHLESCPRLVDLSAVKGLGSSLEHFAVVGRSMRIRNDLLEALARNGGLENLELIDCSVSDEAVQRMTVFAPNLISFTVKGIGISEATLETAQRLVSRNRLRRMQQ